MRYAYLMQEVVLALIVENNHLLVGQRPFEPYQGYIEVPGGKREANETLRQTLQRELLEEINLRHFSAQVYFQVDVSLTLRLIWYVVKPLSAYHAGIYPQLSLIPLNQLSSLNWIPHNRVFLDALESIPTHAEAYQVYVYPSDDPECVLADVEALLSDAYTIKKQPFMVFKDCLQVYQDRYPAFVKSWLEDLAGN